MVCNCCCCCRKKDDDYDGDNDDVKKEWPLWCKILKWTFIVLFSLILLLFILIFVILPIVFMESVELQRLLMFPNFDQPENPQYENYDLYGAKGVLNRYVVVNNIQESSPGKLSLGVWQVVPKSMINQAEQNENFNYTKALIESNEPIVIYFHGQSGTRIYPLPTYEVLREFFHVFAFDYRSYGDSTEALLTELGVVKDAVQVYEYITHFRKDIYIWGHSLGTALSTYTFKRIMEDDKIKIKPRALMLEAPFTTMREEVPNHPLGKFIAWVPWFDATVLDPLENNNFLFKTSTNIESVNAPIMIVHAEDDSIIPCFLGEKLYNQAKSFGKDVRFHKVPANVKSNHMEVHKWNELPNLIREFKDHVEFMNKPQNQNKQNSVTSEPRKGNKKRKGSNLPKNTFNQLKSKRSLA